MEAESENKNKQENLEKRVKELEESWKRALADYKNLERRVLEERDAVVKFANTALLLKFLPLYDALKAGLTHHEKELAPIFSQLQSLLASEGLEAIKVKKGDHFDARTMEALSGKNGDKVSKVVYDGFTLSGKVIRPSRVEVGK